MIGEEFYSPENFKKFVESFFSARAKFVHQEHFQEEKNRNSSIIIYHINPRNVTLIYTSKETGFKKSEPDYNYVSIMLTGEESAVNEITDIIERERQKQSPLEKMFRERK